MKDEEKCEGEERRRSWGAYGVWSKVNRIESIDTLLMFPRDLSTALRPLFRLRFAQDDTWVGRTVSEDCRRIHDGLRGYGGPSVEKGRARYLRLARRPSGFGSVLRNVTGSVPQSTGSEQGQR